MCVYDAHTCMCILYTLETQTQRLMFTHMHKHKDTHTDTLYRNRQIAHTDMHMHTQIHTQITDPFVNASRNLCFFIHMYM